MKAVCSVCEKVIKGKGRKVSLGICDDCLKRIVKTQKNSMWRCYGDNRFVLVVKCISMLKNDSRCKGCKNLKLLKKMMGEANYEPQSKKNDIVLVHIRSDSVAC